MEEIKNIPKIRFEGFEDDWEQKVLGKHSIIKGRLGWKSLKQEEYLDDGPSMIAGRHINNGTIDWSVVDHIPDWRYNESPEIMLEENDVIFSKDGSLGNPAVIKNLKTKATINSTMMLVRLNGKINSDFFYQVLRTKQFDDLIKLKVSGSSIPHLFQADMQKFIFSAPQTSEQSIIGEFFLNLDNLIAEHQKKHDKLVILKKAMLEKMFPKKGATAPEIRFKGFKGDWDLKRFGECVLIQRGGSPRPIDKFMTNDESGINWIKIGDVSKDSRYITHTKERIKPEGIKHSREVFKGDLILSNSMSFGRPYIMAIDGCIHDGWLLIRDEKKMFNLEYLLQLLSSDYMINQYKALASGGVVINLNSELVQSTNVYVPSIEEQKKIGAYFQKYNKLISLQQKELDKLKNFKKACLEKMFV